MKRMIAILCVLAMLFSMPVYAEETTPMISADNVTAEAGASIDVPIRITGNTGVLGATITIQYDEKLTLTAITAGEAFSELTMTKPGKLSANPVNIVWDGVDGQSTDDGIIATLTFTAPDENGTYPITLSYPKGGSIFDNDLNEVEVEMRAGSVTVGCTNHVEVIDEAVEPTCTKAGLTQGSHCSVCGKIIVAQEEVSAKGHTEVIDAAVEPTCTKTGLTQGSHCSVCNTVLVAQNEISAKGHDYTVGQYDETNHWKKCSRCDSTTELETHSFEAHDCETAASCTGCDYVKPAGQHSFGDYVQTKAPTCTEKGEETRTCSICSHTETRTVDALGHDFGEWVVTTDSTCTEKGEKTRTCQREGCDASETETIDAKGHAEVIDAAVEPTCTKTGLTQGSHCSVCGKIIVAQTEISAKGHTEVIDAAVEPTCTKTGLTQGSHCSVCNTVLVAQSEISAKGHDYTVGQYDDHWKKCSRCDSTTELETHSFEAHDCETAASCTGCDYVKPAGQHSYGDYVETKAPTCTEKGEETRTCSICSHTETRTVDALGHTAGKSVRENVVPATKQTKGSYDEVVYCKVCEAEISRVNKTISKTDKDRSSSSNSTTIPSNNTTIELPSEEPTFPFIDVPASAWYYDAVKSAWKVGLIDGVTSTEFRPDENMTVAQAIKLASALHQMNHSGKVSLENGYPNWYSTYVDYAVDNDLIESAYGNYATAQMNSAVTRAKFVHIFHAATGDLKKMNTVADNAIPDVKSGDAFATEIYDFYRAGILIGSDENGTFHPTDSIKRSEVSTILNRMYDSSVRKTITLR